MAKLTRIESLVRDLRDELAQLDQESSKGEQLKAITNLREVTPAGWSRTFTSLTRTEPTVLAPFERIGDDMLIGFDATDQGSILCSQEPVIAAAEAGVKVSMDVWVTKPIKWITFEFIVPEPLRSEHNIFYFYWVGAAREAQRVNVLSYRQVASGEYFHDHFDPAYMYSDPGAEIRTIQFKREPDLTDCKICLSFDVAKLAGFSLQEARLFVPRAEP